MRPRRYLEVNVGRTLYDIEPKDIFKDKTPLTKQIKEKFKQIENIEWEGLCTAKETMNRIQRLFIEWDSLLIQYSFDKGWKFYCPSGN